MALQKKKPVGFVLMKLEEILDPEGLSKMQLLKGHCLAGEQLFLVLSFTRTSVLRD